MLHQMVAAVQRWSINTMAHQRHAVHSLLQKTDWNVPIKDIIKWNIFDAM